MNILAQTIDGIQEILAICPCCGEIFRLVEGKFVFPQQRPKTSVYLDLVALEGDVSEKEDRLVSAKNIDPQDVKVIFDPVEYLIFHGLNSEHGVNLLEFVSRAPLSRSQEAV